MFSTIEAQPEGVTITWDLPDVYSFIYDFYGDVNSSDLDLWALSAFQNQSIAEHFAIDFLDSDGIHYYGSTDDDTEQTPIVPGGTLMHVKTLSAHQPGSVVSSLNSQASAQFPDDPRDAWAVLQGRKYANSTYYLKLLDTNGDPFPGVFLQEQFVPTDPPEPGFLTNLNHGSGDLWRWETILNPPGRSDATDRFTRIWPLGDSAIYTYTHHYWAATLGVSGGLDMGPFDITFTPGLPGTAIQSH